MIIDASCGVYIDNVRTKCNLRWVLLSLLVTSVVVNKTSILEIITRCY